MAYYSDIAVVMRKEKYIDLLKSIHAISDSKLKRDVLILLKSAIIKKSPSKAWVVLKFESRKWYINDYAAVKFMDNFFDMLTNEEAKNNYRIIRIGEDYDDIEIFGSCNVGISLERSIKVEF